MIDLFILTLLFAIWFSLQSLRGILIASRLKIREDIQQQSRASNRELTEVADALERLSIVLIYHDATVRGTDPEAIGSTQELLDTLRKRKSDKDE